METRAPALRLTYSASGNALYIQLREADASETVELAENVYVDLGENGVPIGVEFINASDFLEFLTRNGGELVIPHDVGIAELPHPREIAAQLMPTPLTELGLSQGIVDALASRQVSRVGEVLILDPDQLLSIHGFGAQQLMELREKLTEGGFLALREWDKISGNLPASELQALHDGINRWLSEAQDRSPVAQ
jgi:uncharacterized protein YuzE